MFRWRAGGRGRGGRQKVLHLNTSVVLSLGNLPMLPTFEFDRAEDWVNLNLTVHGAGP